MKLSKEQNEQFERDGYLFFPSLFTPAEVRRGTAVHVTSGRQTAFADTTARTRFPTGDHDPSGVLKGLNPCQDT